MFVPKQEKHTAGNFLMLFSVFESGEYKEAAVEEQLFPCDSQLFVHGRNVSVYPKGH